MFAYKPQRFDTDNKVGALWCSLMHNSPMWPMHGHYECRVCGRQYDVPWGETVRALPRRADVRSVATHEALAQTDL